MDFLASALKALPSIASSPLSFVAYIITIGAWIYSYNQSQNLKLLMKKISFIPEKDRKTTIVSTIGNPLPDNISAEQWIVSQRQKYFLVAFIVTSVVVISITTVTLYQGAQIRAAKEASEARIEICRRQIQNANEQWERNKNNLDRRMDELDRSIESWDYEFRRGTTGVIFAPIEQKEAAIAIAKNAQNEIQKLKNQKKEIQAKLDNLNSTPPPPVQCGG